MKTQKTKPLGAVAQPRLVRRFRVHFQELASCMADVDAEDHVQAIAKAKRGDVIEGTQDTEPGNLVWNKAYAEEI